MVRRPRERAGLRPRGARPPAPGGRRTGRRRSPRRHRRRRRRATAVRALRDFLLSPPEGAPSESPVVVARADAAGPWRRRPAPAAAAAAGARDVPRAVGVLCATEDAAAV